MVAISTDDLETLKRFKADRQAPYAFLSDPGGKVARQYGGVYPVIGLAHRANYVIGRDGRVVSAVVGDEAVDPSASVDACPAKG